MQKRVKKLNLSSETLLRLAGPGVANVEGAAPRTYYNFCTLDTVTGVVSLCLVC